MRERIGAFLFWVVMAVVALVAWNVFITTTSWGRTADRWIDQGWAAIRGNMEEYERRAAGDAESTESGDEARDRRPSDEASKKATTEEETVPADTSDATVFTGTSRILPTDPVALAAYLREQERQQQVEAMARESEMRSIQRRDASTTDLDQAATQTSVEGCQLMVAVWQEGTDQPYAGPVEIFLRYGARRESKTIVGPASWKRKSVPPLTEFTAWAIVPGGGGRQAVAVTKTTGSWGLTQIDLDVPAAPVAATTTE